MYFSGNSGFTRNSGDFEADGRIHYYKRQLYLHISDYFSMETLLDLKAKKNFF